MRTLRAALLALALTLLAAGTAVATTPAGTLTAADAPGFKAAGTGERVALLALSRPPSRALRRADARWTALRAAPQRRIVSAVFTLGSAAKARAALRSARRDHRRLRGVADEAWRRTRATKRAATTFVLLRAGRRIGALRVLLPGRRAFSAATAENLARTMATALHRADDSTAFQRTLDGIAPDGSITAATALRAFAITYGPLPGVRRPKGRLGVPESGTLAMQLVARVWDQLTPAQRAAVDRALGAPHDETSAPVARAAAQVLTPSPAYQAKADQYAGFFRDRLPGINPVIRVFTASEDITASNGSKAWADALPVNAAGQWGTGTPAYCRVRVPPFGQAESGKPFFELIMAHEVFHCFQFQVMTAWRQRSAWIIEGMADWAATSAYATTAAVGAGPYRLYLQTAQDSLLGRSYDATGFWHWADEHAGVGSLWPKVPDVLRSPDDTEAFVAAGGMTGPFLESWASSVFRLPSAGAAWKQTRPYAISRAEVPVPPQVVTTDTSVRSASYRIVDAVVMRNDARPIVRLAAESGKVRAGVNAKDFGPIDERYFCWGKCKCPPKSTGELPPHEKLAGQGFVTGVTAGSGFGIADVSYHTLEEYCRKEEPPKDAPSGPAETNGDPHLTSFDGLHFDFQAAGEFVLARSSSGDLEVQARQEPWARSKTVTVNTQVAMRVGGRRVTVSAATGDPIDRTPVVRIDGAVDDLPRGTSVPVGDGVVSRRGGVGGWVDVRWPDGSLVVVRPVSSYGVAVVLQLAPGRADAVRGILGDFDGSPRNDLADRSGKRIAYTAKATDDWGPGVTRFNVAEEFESGFFDRLYNDRYGDAWRIRQEDSLFDYAAGESTRTFTDRGVPTKPVDPEELRRRRAAEAERTCREAGVTRPGPLADCILDVAATGEQAFAEDARHAQDAASVLWTQLAGGGDIGSDLRLLRAADGVLHVAFTRDLGGADASADLPIDATGRPGPVETIRAADTEAGLFLGPDGGVRAVSAELPSGAPSGVYQYARTGPGAWAPLGLVTGFGSSYASRPLALHVPGAGLLTVSPMAGVSRLFKGEPAQDSGVDFPVPDGCYASSPAIARDGASGAVWVAWHQWDCPQLGVFAAPVDPATGTFGAPVQAPDSTWEGSLGPDTPDLSLSEELAFTGRPGRPGLFLAYQSGEREDVVVWPVGAASAVRLPRREDGGDRVRIAAEPGTGRLWVVWRGNRYFWAQRTTDDGAPDGRPRTVAPPPNETGDLLRLADLQVDAGAGGLELLYGLRTGDTPGGLYRARIDP